MMKFISRLFGSAALALSLVSFSASAIFNGTETSVNDYGNHLVRIVLKGNTGISTKTCGGMLVGGKYIFTASHCLDGTYTVSLKVYQGIDVRDPDAVYDRSGELKKVRTHETNKDWWAYLDPMFNNQIEPLFPHAFEGDVRDFNTAAYWRNLFETMPHFLDDRDQEVKDNPVHNSHNDSDWGLIILDEPIPHQSSRILKPLADHHTGEQFLKPGETFTFRGWGSTAYGGASGSTPSTLMEATFQLYRPYPLTQARSANIGSLRGPYCSEDIEKCTFQASAQADMIGVNTGNNFPGVGPGDSGSPIIRGDYFYGGLFGSDRNPTPEDELYVSVFSDMNAEMDNIVAQSELLSGVFSGSDEVYVASFSHLGYLMDSIVRYVDDVVYPTDMGITVESESSDSHEILIPIQNFTDTVIVLDPVELSGGFESLNGQIDAAGVSYDDFLMVKQDCAGVLEPKAGCMVKLVLNQRNLFVFDSVVEASINLGIEDVADKPLTIRLYPTFCDKNPSHSDCVETCDDNPSLPGCGNEAQEPDLPQEPELEPEVPQIPDSDDGADEDSSQGGSSSGGSVSFCLLGLFGLLLTRRFSTK
ncbi:trypsin-like serine protease [Vibrio halioticoli]|nr:trypsin-like serine protease [Vibrio halioticoli]